MFTKHVYGCQGDKEWIVVVCALSPGLNLELHFPELHLCVLPRYNWSKEELVKFRMQKWDSGSWSLLALLLSSVVTDGCRDVQQFPDGTYSLLVNVQLFFPTLGPADHPRCLTVDPQTWQQLLIGLAMNSPFPAPSAAQCAWLSEMTSKVGDAFSILQLSAASPKM